MKYISNRKNLSKFIMTSVAALSFFSTNAANASDAFNLYNQQDIEKKCPSIKDSLVVKLSSGASYSAVFNVAYGVKRSGASSYYKPTYPEPSIFKFRKNNLASIAFGSDSAIPAAKSRTANQYGSQGYDIYTTTLTMTGGNADQFVLVPRDIIFLVVESGTTGMGNSLIQKVDYYDRHESGNSLYFFDASKRHNSRSGFVLYTPYGGAPALPKKVKMTELDYVHVYAGGKPINWWEASNTMLYHMKDNNNKNIVCPG